MLLCPRLLSNHPLTEPDFISLTSKGHRRCMIQEKIKWSVLALPSGLNYPPLPANICPPLKCQCWFVWKLSRPDLWDLFTRKCNQGWSPVGWSSKQMLILLRQILIRWSTFPSAESSRQGAPQHLPHHGCQHVCPYSHHRWHQSIWDECTQVTGWI